MEMNSTRFDEMLDKLAAYQIDKSAPCDCRQHAPHLYPPRTPRAGDWRRRFMTDEWSGLRATRALGLTFADALPIEARQHADATGAEGCTDARGNLWVDHDAQHPVRTIAHELAHQVLGHLGEPWQLRWKNTIAGMLTRLGVFSIEIAQAMLVAITETEAESTAFLVTSALGFPEGEAAALKYSARYISNNMPMDKLDRARVKAAAEQILTAGRVAEQQKMAA